MASDYITYTYNKQAVKLNLACDLCVKTHENMLLRTRHFRDRGRLAVQGLCLYTIQQNFILDINGTKIR